MIRAWFQYRGDRLVTCPETHLAAGCGAWTRARPQSGKCSRWPERQDCGQECLKQIEDSPDHCLVREILTRWYQDKNCTICGKPIGEIHWADHRPALLSPEQLTVEWLQVRPENGPGVLETMRPSAGTATSSRLFAGNTPTWW